MSYPCCFKKQHTKEAVNLICLTSTCKHKGVICVLCKSTDHTNHNVIPFKMFLSKVQQMLKKTKQNPKTTQVQQSEQKMNLNQEKAKQIQETHIESLCLLKFHVQGLAEQIAKIQQDIMHHYENIRKIFDEQADQQRIVTELVETLTGRPIDNYIQFKEKSLKLSSMIKIQKNQYSLKQRLSDQLGQYFQQADSFKKNIQIIASETITHLRDIFNSKKILERPSTARSQVSSKLGKYTFSSTYKAKNIQLTSQNRQVKQGDPVAGKLVMVNQHIGSKKQSVKIKIINASASVMIGLGLREVIKSKNFKVSTGIGHGLFMMGTNGFIYSHNDSKLNMVMKGFSFKPNQQIEMLLQNNSLTFKRKSDNKSYTLSLGNIKEQQYSQLGFCVCLNSNNDKVTLL